MAHSMYVAEPSPLVVVMGVGCLAFAGAFRADAFYHEVGGLSNESLGQVYCRNRNLLQTECAVARLAMEMYVTVVIGLTGGVAELVAHTFAAVINLMQQMVLLKEGEGAEYAGLVNGVNLILQLRHGNGAVTLSQRLQHQQPVSSRLDAMLRQYFFQLLH